MNSLLKLRKRYPMQMDALFIIVGFILGANLLIFFKQAGVNEFGRSYLLADHGFRYVTPSLAGMVIGAVLFWLEFGFFRHIHHFRRPWIFGIKFIVFSSVIVGTSFVIQSVVNMVVLGDSISSAISKSWSFIQTDIFLSIYVYLFLLGSILNFIRELGNRFGHGIIIDYLSGKYRVPMEEDRVFMFMDMNDSTSIAEKLGHVKYSRLLNKCFSVLDTILINSDAEVYQFVGDEVVLTWNQKKLPDPGEPIQLFSRYEKELERKSQEFREKFGIVPTFKASINAGHVVVTELGGYRKEVAYHGDVLNTASRILELCKKKGKRLLFTGSYLKMLKDEMPLDNVASIRLRGKTDEVEIYALG